MKAGSSLLPTCFPHALLPGFILRAQHFFAKTYSKIYKVVKNNFAKQWLRAACKEQEWRTLTLLQDPTQLMRDRQD